MNTKPRNERPPRSPWIHPAERHRWMAWTPPVRWQQEALPLRGVVQFEDVTS